MMFTPYVCEKIGYYVYILRDPTNENRIFYVGKGTGNRVFDHAKGVKDKNGISEKITTIKNIIHNGHKIHYEIVRHGLTKSTAFEVESALIDTCDDLSNIVKGHHASIRGKMTPEEIMAKYGSKEISIVEPSILIIIRKSYHESGVNDIYEAARGDWFIGPRRNKAKYAIVSFNGVVRGVYKIASWEPVVVNSEEKIKHRWRFTGHEEHNLNHYMFGDVTEYIKKSQFPIRYLNC